MGSSVDALPCWSRRNAPNYGLRPNPGTGNAPNPRGGGGVAPVSILGTLSARTQEMNTFVTPLFAKHRATGSIPERDFQITRPLSVGIFVTVLTVGLLFAMYTNHAWEDWYITYRASKNLAIGNGLVFEIGQKIHTFTSPLGTLIPSLLNVVTGNYSDDLVLWLYRLVNCILLAATASIVLRTAKTTGMKLFSTLIMLGLLAVDARIIDFSINGMETAYMVFFLALCIHTMSMPGKYSPHVLGFAWGGLMWSRPDSFVYIAGLTVGYLLFSPKCLGCDRRMKLLEQLFTAGLVAAVVYLPWIVWTNYYYGTPIPHTIVAKGLNTQHPSSIELMHKLYDLPFSLMTRETSIAYTFMPPYFGFGGWPSWLSRVTHVLSVLCALYWVIPSGRPQGRAVSFAVFLGHFYLNYVAAYVAPWYVPNVTFLSIFVLGNMTQQITSYCAERKSLILGKLDLARTSLFAGGACLLFGSLMMTLAIAYQLKLQQEIIENGNRKEIGHWLSEHAVSQRDTVFCECLGYIGFFSNLRMYDFPGMSSPEVVEVRRDLATDAYGPIIRKLKPHWIVLRPHEIDSVNRQTPSLLASHYHIAKTFNVSRRISSQAFLPGRAYLENDQHFKVFQRNDTKNTQLSASINR
jgi:hypothetical protein